MVHAKGQPRLKRFVSLQVKITVLSVLLVLASLKLVGALSYRQIVTSTIEPLVGKRLDYSARGIAITIPGEQYQKVITAFLKSPKGVADLPEFKKIHQFLLISQRQNELTADVETLIKDPHNPEQMIALVTSNEENQVKRLPLDPWVERVFKEGLPLFTPIYSKDGGIWITGLAPIETEKGDIAGVIRVNYEASQEEALAKKDILNTLLKAGAFGFALALIMGIFLGRTLSRPVKALSAAAKEIMKGNLNPSFEVTTNDEIGTLANIFRNMISEIRTNRQSLEDYSKNLETKVRDRTFELKEVNQKTAAMLDSLGQGFFLFQSDGKCLPIHSKACLQLLEGSPEGRSLGEYLHSGLTGGIDDWVNALFSEPLPFESIAPLGVKRYPHSGGAIVELSYRPIRNEDGKVIWVIVVATDRTTEVQAQKMAELEKARSRRILLIVESKDQFLSFIREVDQIIHELETLIAARSGGIIPEVMRGFHTIKGGSDLFQFQELRDLAHQQESAVSSLKEKADKEKSDLKSSDWLVLDEAVQSIRQEFENSLLELRPILGDTLNPGVKSYNHSESTLMALLNQARAAGIGNDWVAAWEVTLLHEPFIQGFKHFNEVVIQAADKLGKLTQPIVFEGGKFKVYLKVYERLLSSLIHAFRNAVDHGIESPEQRLEIGKPEAGEIRVALHKFLRAEIPWLQIQIQDDGAGISVGRIKEKLKEKNPLDPLLSAEDSQIFQVLFRSGLSTKTEVTDLSGRGVGLDAVLYEAQRLNGSASLGSQPGRGTVLTIEVPLLGAGV